MTSTQKAVKGNNQDASFGARLIRDLRRHWGIYLLLVPALVYYIVFCYFPMSGAIIAFKDFVPTKGIWGSEWAGFTHFRDFFGSYYFFRLLKNTLTISLASLVFAFPMPIIFALLLNEIHNNKFKRVVQTVTYMPHFLSLVVACSLVRMFTADTGVVVQIMSLFGFEPVSLLSQGRFFVPIYVISDIWQNVGWGSIIYLSAISGIDPALYEAAIIDGAGRWKQTLHVTLPGISTTIIIMFIMRAGSIMNVGFEKIILLYNEGIYNTADVISTFVYRRGLQQFQWSYGSAVGLFNSVVNFIIVVVVNQISRKVSETSLW
ncbi:MAG TPA: ABC transporter permease subunit [Candidatus Eisenbergiella merdipullorum]|uniref:ABC transporter permease subunit n=1 Tax=Candidatus Eisenbergiella merdipullorum TaxID=2838553 RepID=A0A9D2I602_9FIRM|nr:ABC transporter permease subunit [Candidatus Eisenbergiella merdipullorum]